MSIQKLDTNVISKLRSSFNVNSVTQCVVELVCNCLDAKSSAIAVRTNLLTFKVQVADNGEGINRENLEFITVRYTTNKCRTIKDLERQLKTYGFRGEALANIVEMSDSVHISSRHKDSVATFTKVISKTGSEIKQVKQRPSVGTTVTVFGCLSSAPVRQQRIVPEVELEEIKGHLESLVIINPRTSFTLRNDATGDMLLSSPRHDSIIHAFEYLHPEVNSQFTLLKAVKDRILVEAIIQKELILSKNYQYLYVNKRPVKSQKVTRRIRKAFLRKMSKKGKDPTFYNTKEHPIYIMHIKCPQKCIDNIDEEVELTCWTSVLACVDKLLSTLLEIPEKSLNKHGFQPIQNPHKENLNCGVSQLSCAVQATAYKRKATLIDSPRKSQRVIEDVISLTPGKVPAKLGFRHTQTTGDYQIQNSEAKITDEPKIVKSIMKKPLGINVRPAVENCKEMNAVNFDQRSVYSRLTTDEHKGKGLIMDMFLKSTQVYKQDDQEVLLDESKETVEESNFMYENNVNDHIRGINTTMSISVNLKKRKLSNKIPSAVYNNQVNCSELDSCSNLFRRSNLDKAKMISKEVQTSQILLKQKSFQTELAEKLDQFSLESFSQRNGDYTILMNNAEHKQKFRMVKIARDMVNAEWPEPFKPLKICHCEQKGNMFNFKNAKFKIPETPRLFFRGLRKESPKPPRYHEWNQCSESPYFKKSNICGFQVNQIECRDIPSYYKRDKFHNLNNMHASYQHHGTGNYPAVVKKGNQPLKYCEVQPHLEIFRKNYLNLHTIENDNQIKQYHQQNGVQINRELGDWKKQNHQQSNVLRNHCEENYNPVFGCPPFKNLPINQVENPYSVPVHQIPRHFPNAQHISEYWFQNEPESESVIRHIKDTKITPNNNFKNAHLHNLDKDYQKAATTLLKSTHIPQHLKHEPFGFQLQTKYNGLKNVNQQDEQRCNPEDIPFGDNQKTSTRYQNQVNFNMYGLQNEYRVHSGFQKECRDCRDNEPGLACWKHHNQREYLPEIQYKVPKEIFRNCTDIDALCQNENLYAESNPFPVGRGQPRSNKQIFESTRQESEQINNSECCQEHYKQRENVKNVTRIESKHSGNIKISSIHNNPSDFMVHQTADQYQSQNEFRFHEEPLPNDKMFSLEQCKEPNAITKSLGLNYHESHLERYLPERDINISSKYMTLQDSQIPLVSKPLNKKDFNKMGEIEDRYCMGSPDLFFTISPVKQNSTDLQELGQYCDRQNIMKVKNEILQVKNNPRENFLSFENTVKDKSQILIDSQNEWLKQKNEHGRKFYINKRTGVVAVKTPTISNDKFIFEERLGFIPKGMSPVMVGHKEVDKTLSVNAKKKLHNMILQAYEDELLFVKWKHFINDDPKSFFEQIYKEMSNQSEGCVPVIYESDFKMSKNKHNFNANIFGDMVVLGQIDKKFICALSGDILVMFDQHAVNERIKVEKYIKEYKGMKISCVKKVTVFLPNNDLDLLKTHLPYLESLGLGVDFFTNGLHVTGMPLCIKEKFSEQEDIAKILNLLIKDTVHFLKTTRGSAINHLPKIIQNIINHKACRAAIKFGTELSKRKCQNLLAGLAKCQLPFQCAHGRPTLAPILSLGKVPAMTKKVRNVNLKKLLDP
ncbi:uncharacterized protein LOC126739195 [Anthonomus grandis grandis]|uniref:uncharacterized protein LOC126739195 n=1 Tax=Anthonomus grandis grandis TaxID=2921223 RepID=UPI0021666D6C|nr:uncharacterized protein LOC126739195 [Anthonomus grandis grandis]